MDLNIPNYITYTYRMPRTDLSAMTAEQKKEHKAKVNREKQKRHYELHKEKEQARKRSEYAKKVKTPPPTPKGLSPPSTPTAEAPKEIKKGGLTGGTPRSGKSKLHSKTLTMRGLLADLMHTDIGEGSKKLYENTAKQLLLVLYLNDDEFLSPPLNDYKKALKAIDDSDYSLNSKKNIVQFILYMADHTLLYLTSKAKEEYKTKFAVYKEDSIAQNADKIEAEPIFPLHIALQKITNRYGGNSKIGLISRLYSEFTPRDDFILKIVPNKKEAKDKEINYIVAEGDHYTIILNNYKTSDSNGAIIYPVSEELGKDLKEYMTENELGAGDYLFGDKKLSKFISEKLNKVGISGGINTFRHMVISKLLEDEETTTEDRVKKAKLMGHSPLVQLRYLRKTKKE
jgi:hypothetical protein